MIRIVTIVGARPQFVKAAVLSRMIRDRGDAIGIHEYLVHTGQHYDDNMSEVFFREMGIPTPDLNLGIGSGGHGATTGRMLAGIEEALLDQKPDILLVYGDTNSTLAGALAASKLHIPVAHVEAGLRSYMMAMPEEQNRRLTDHLATWLLCPTDTAIANLQKEGITDAGFAKPNPDHKSVVQVGDLMYEASMHYRKTARASEEALRATAAPFALLTIHRAENTDDPRRLKAIVESINAASGTRFVFPCHPRTMKILASWGLQFGSHVSVVEPLGYFDMLVLEDRCDFIITDSGGVQKEAYFFEKPCITLRDSTEWVELVDSGWNRLAGADEEKIARAIREIEKPKSHPALYGAGDTAIKILAALTGGAIK